MSQNIGFVWEYITPTVIAIVTTLGGWLIGEGISLLKLKKGSAAADDFDQAMQHAEALAIDWFKSEANTHQTVNIPDAKMAAIVATVRTLAPAAEWVLKIGPDQIASLVQAGLNRWLHYDRKLVLPVPVVNVSTAPAAGGATSTKIIVTEPAAAAAAPQANGGMPSAQLPVS
jgi:hypothetical protein